MMTTNKHLPEDLYVRFIAIEKTDSFQTESHNLLITKAWHCWYRFQTTMKMHACNRNLTPMLCLGRVTSKSKS